MENPLSFHIQRKIIYNYHTRFIVSWWRRYSYFVNELIKISDVVLMNSAYGPSVLFVSIVG